MRAWMLVLLTFGLVQKALTQAYTGDESESIYEEKPDPNSEQEQGSDYLDREPEMEWDMLQAPGEDQPPWSNIDLRRSSKEFGDYTPFLLCLKRKQAQQRQAQQKASPKGLKPLQTQANSWVEHLKSVEVEVAKTRCRPREVCVQVSAEHPVSTNTFYVPKCISVHRCGGCCNGEQRRCISTSQEAIGKRVIELQILPLREPMPVSILFANHTGCECSSSLNPRRSVNRRASKGFHARIVRPSNRSTESILKASPAWCSKTQVSCSSGLSWDPIRCLCVEDQKLLVLSGNAKRASVCGVHRVFSEDSCSCVCKLDHNRSKCGPHRVFSADFCRCVCKNGLNDSSCESHQVFNDDSCQCACKKGLDGLNCRPHQVFSKDSCRCVCNNGITQLICGPHRLLQDCTCACVCPEPNLRNSCKPDWDWDTDKCRCVCRKICPKHTSLNETTCQCDCQDQGAGCSRRGMMFDPHSSATGYHAQGGGPFVRVTITIVTLLLLTKLPESL